MTGGADASRIALTALYVPGDRADRIAKAFASGADIVIVDLEDAVAPAHKDIARAGLDELRTHPGAAIHVRVNARGSQWHTADLAALAVLPFTIGVRLPKVESAEDVERAARMAPGRPVHALIESALGVERAFEIAGAGVASIGIGEADLRSQLGLPRGSAGEPGLQWARSRIVNAAAAAGIAPPMMSVYPDVADAPGLAASCAVGRATGFLGRAAIHPRQLATIEAVFLPTAEEVALATSIVERVGTAGAAGVGAVVLDDGSFLDVAMVAGARRTLALAARGVTPVE